MRLAISLLGSALALASCAASERSYAQRTGCGGLGGDALVECQKSAPKHSPEADRKAAAAAFAARQLAERNRQAERDRLAKVPVAPSVGMTEKEFQEVMDANDARLRAYQATHPAWADLDSSYDIRWGAWNRCRPNRTTTLRGVHVQWVCDDLRERRYVYVDNGVVTAIQE